jgi:2',3'-cyclic-nucleotide 2'-phosphodiesterase (5'-nucleotidase family)
MDLFDTTKGTEFVSANLLDLKTKKPLTKPYVIKDYGNLRVGIVGLLNEADFPKGTSLLDSTRLAIMPHLQAAKQYIPSLARKVDAVVLLCELPTAALDTLLKEVPQIDLVISNGGLRSGEAVATVGKTRIVGTGSSGYNGHYAMLEFNPAWKDSIGFEQHQEALTDAYEEKGVWADRVASFAAAPPAPTTKPSTAASSSITPAPKPTITAVKKPELNAAPPPQDRTRKN